MLPPSLYAILQHVDMYRCSVTGLNLYSVAQPWSLFASLFYLLSLDNSANMVRCCSSLKSSTYCSEPLSS